MKAMVIDRFGGAEQLHLTEIGTPEPEAGDVLIEIAYTSVNPVDWKIREGMLEGLFPHAFPLIPGWDAAGTVAAVGDGVHEFGVGERVYAYCRKPRVQWGTYAEYVTMPAAAVAPMPQGLSFAEAATIPLVGLTCWQALFDAAHLAAGQSILILNGAGGTGSLAIQFAKHAGARVVACASAGNHEYLRSLGADVLIDYRSTDVAAAVRAHIPEGVDVIYANIGGAPHMQSYPLIKPGGTLVSILILNGAGGTGSLAIQFAKHAGARVVACASAGNHEYLRSLGADVLIDYRSTDVVAAVKAHFPEGVDVIYANIGGAPHMQSYPLIKPGGTLVSIVDQPDQNAANDCGATAVYVFVEPSGIQLREIARLIDAGFVKPPQITVMNLEEAAEAQRLSEAHHVRGKVALKVS